MKTYILLLFIILFSCNEEELTKSSNMEIGQEYKDGTIFYIFIPSDPEYIEEEQHGYIVSGELGQFSWGCTNIPLEQFNVEGKYNTEVIIDACGPNNAAGECNSLGWWLPSFEEWELLIGSNVLLNHEYTSYYWTSSKHSYSDAYCIRPADGNIINKHVNTLLKIRGIKQF